MMTECSDKMIPYWARYCFSGGEGLLDQEKSAAYTEQQNEQVL